jgi:hypothetical protein
MPIVVSSSSMVAAVIMPPFVMIIMCVPVSFSLPPVPVLLQLSIGNMPVLVIPSSVIIWQASQGTGYPRRTKVTPGPVIVTGSVPMSFVGTVPEAVIEKNSHFDIGNKVCVASGYQNHWRRSM